MTSSAAVEASVRYQNATATTGQRCDGAGRLAPEPTSRYAGRAICPGCNLSQRVTDGRAYDRIDHRYGRVMMSHYVRPVSTTEAKPAVAAGPTEERAHLALVVSERLREAHEVLRQGDPASPEAVEEPQTVAEFVKAITSLALQLAAAQTRIAELEVMRETPNANDVRQQELDDWKWNFLRLNELIMHYGASRGWCGDFERIVANWNQAAGFKAGAQMYHRQNLPAVDPHGRQRRLPYDHRNVNTTGGPLTGTPLHNLLYA